MTNLVSEKLAGNNLPGEITRLHEFVSWILEGRRVLEEMGIFPHVILGWGENPIIRESCIACIIIFFLVYGMILLSIYCAMRCVCEE